MAVVNVILNLVQDLEIPKRVFDRELRPNRFGMTQGRDDKY
ncbi:MAG: hypothetical protein Q8P13_02520 [bacterium]|nr:hypothetical protein [bacterium]